MSGIRDALAAIRWRPLLGAAAGVGIGAWWALSVGCLSGSCPLTSNPWLMAALGGWVGWSTLAPSKRKVASDPPASVRQADLRDVQQDHSR
jgi:hypothetical protein